MKNKALKFVLSEISGFELFVAPKGTKKVFLLAEELDRCVLKPMNKKTVIELIIRAYESKL